ncbi:MAG: CPBP family intramembrane glutamic endopeptidase [Terriglobia bacterium]
MGDTENLFQDVSGARAETFAPRPAPPLVPREIWTLRDLLLFVGLIPFALLASNLLLYIGYVTLRPFAGWRTPVDSLTSNTFFLLILQSIFYFFLLGYLVLMARIQHHQPFWSSLGWKKPTGRQVLVCLAGGGVLAVVITLAPPLLPDAEGFPLERLFTSRAAYYAIGAFAIGVAPVIEELVFRGLLFAIFERAVGVRFAIATTAVLFAGLHIPEYWHAWNHVLMILLVGGVFSLARGRSGTLTPSILLHVGYNTCMMAGLFFTTQHFRALEALFERW